MCLCITYSNEGTGIMEIDAILYRIPSSQATQRKDASFLSAIVQNTMNVYISFGTQTYQKTLMKLAIFTNPTSHLKHLLIRERKNEIQRIATRRYQKQSWKSIEKDGIWTHSTHHCGRRRILGRRRRSWIANHIVVREVVHWPNIGVMVWYTGVLWGREKAGLSSQPSQSFFFHYHKILLEQAITAKISHPCRES